MLRILAITLALAMPASAGQLEDQIALGLRFQGIVVDMSTLTQEQKTALHFELSSPDDDMRARINILNILRKNPETRILRK